MPSPTFASPAPDALLAGVTRAAITPALQLLPAALDTPQARVMLLAIGLQESQLTHRRQLGGGPARGLWQFERGSQARGGGVWGVVLHDASRYWLAQLCAARGCLFTADAIYARIEQDDVLAAGLARLLLFCDRAPLPALGATSAAWQLYAKRTWCPGRPRPDEWPENYRRALAFVQGGLA